MSRVESERCRNEQEHAARLRESLTLSDELGMAMRAARRRLRFSQRDLAERQGWSQSRVARLEARAEKSSIDVVIEALAVNNFRLAIESEDQLQVIDRPAEMVAWLRHRMQSWRLSSRQVGHLAHVSQRSVIRLLSERHIWTVSLGLFAKVAAALGGRTRIVWDNARTDHVVDKGEWPTAAVLPRTRGGARRLAAHGWIRATTSLGPFWYWMRRFPRDPFRRAPTWTAEWPRDPRGADATVDPGIEPLGVSGATFLDPRLAAA